MQLERLTEAQLEVLGNVLWSWPLHIQCSENRSSSEQYIRSKRLGKFFDYYRALTASYDPDVKTNEQSAVSTHEDLFRIIKILKEESSKTRAEIVRLIFANDEQGSQTTSDQENVVNMAVKAMLMINCTAETPSSNLLEDGVTQAHWRPEVTLVQYLNECFPLTDHPSLNDQEELKFLDIKKSLTAKKLKKHASVKFRPTDDLRRHLVFDHKSAVLEVYHHTAFLKEHLRLTRDQCGNISDAEALKLGALPRQLALETLDSIQKILFPLSDPKSRSLLRSLTRTASFDPDTLRFESASIRKDNERDIRYHYLGARLIDLYDELETPTARGLEKWFERKSGARYVMMATLIGVIIAVMFGMLGIALSGYQAWLAYQQWQHPVQAPR